MSSTMSLLVLPIPKFLLDTLLARIPAEDVISPTTGRITRRTIEEQG